MNSRILLTSVLLLSSLLLRASPASDNASNYVTWSDGSNGGTGFNAWMMNSFDGGIFLGPASAQGPNNAALDTSGQSFGLWATNFSTAARELNTPLQSGETLSFSMAYQFDNGNRGFNLGYTVTSLFNFNVNDQGYTWTGENLAAPTPWTGVRENGVLIHFSFTRSGGTIDYTIASAQDANLNTMGSFSASNGIDSIDFYVSGAGGDPGGNLYFNNLNVVPEAQSVVLLLGGMGLLVWFRRRRA